MSHLRTLLYAQHDIEYTRACAEELKRTLGCDRIDMTGDLREQCRGVAVMIDVGGSAPRSVIDAAAEAKFWQVIGTGVDACEVAYILQKGMRIANTPGFASAYGLAECAMMYILMLTRRYQETQATFRSGDFYMPSGRTVDGLTLGILGYGASGRALARRAKAFGMRIEAIDVRPLEDDLDRAILPDFYGGPSDMEAVLQRSDVVSVHLHLTPETRHILNAQRLARMKPTAFVINVARGALVDEEALADAVLHGRLGGAGIDVFSREPADPRRPEYQLPNFIVTPHISGQTDDTVRRRCQIAVENIRRLAAGEPLLHLLDASMGLGKPL